LDPGAPTGGAFAQALEWASRLRLPIHAIDTGLWKGELEHACAQACARLGVPWELTVRSGNQLQDLGEAVHAEDLLIFNQSLPLTDQRSLLLRIQRNGGPATLICPDSAVPLKRILMVNGPGQLAPRFLESIVELCAAFQASLVVLTVARSERKAQRRQQSVREALAGQDVAVDFDFVAGAETALAVAQVALWRRCQLAACGGLIDLTEPLRLFTLPELAVLLLSTPPRDSGPGFVHSARDFSLTPTFARGNAPMLGVHEDVVD
jgi:hypothetical protein